jgi:hypothetical protein
MTDPQVQELIDRFAIYELRARFFRLVDEKDWPGFRACFTDDCRFDLGDGKWISVEEYVGQVEDWLAPDVISVHRGTLPELEFHSPTEASGVWALNDYIEWPSDEDGTRRGYMGFGREYDKYRKVDGEWKISEWILKFRRMDPLPREPLPKTMLGAAAIEDEEYVAQVTGKA